MIKPRLIGLAFLVTCSLPILWLASEEVRNGIKKKVDYEWTKWDGQCAHQRLVSQIPSLSRNNNQSDFINRAKDLRKYLQNRNVGLTIVLLPLSESLYENLSAEMTGKARLRPGPNFLAITDAETMLINNGFTVISPWKDLHLHASQFPNQPLFRDASHYNWRSEEKVINRLMPYIENLKSHEPAKSVMFVGDCFARDLANRLDINGITDIPILWKNASSNEIPYEVSRLPSDSLSEVSNVYWFLLDCYLIPGSKPFRKLYDASVKKFNTDSFWTEAVITQPTSVVHGFEKNYTYSEALVAHYFQPLEDTAGFIGIHFILKNKNPIEAVRLWKKGTSLRLLVEPFDVTRKKKPSLGNLQVIDDTDDFVTDRYWILDWVHCSR